MPYTIKKNPNGGYDVYRKDTGKKVAHSDTHGGAKGYIYHAERGAGERTEKTRRGEV